MQPETAKGGAHCVQRLVRPRACPFCGVKPTLSVTVYARALKMKPLWYLRCENKACPVDVKVFNHDKKQLVADWNKRPNASNSATGDRGASPANADGKA